MGERKFRRTPPFLVDKKWREGQRKDMKGDGGKKKEEKRGKEMEMLARREGGEIKLRIERRFIKNRKTVGERRG